MKTIIGVAMFALVVLGINIYGLCLAFHASLVLGVLSIIIEPACFILGILGILGHPEVSKLIAHWAGL